MPPTYRDLRVWQKAMQLVTDVYAATNGFPRREMFGITSQMRGAAISVPSNIAEGQGRRLPREFPTFYAPRAVRSSNSKRNFRLHRNSAT